MRQSLVRERNQNQGTSTSFLSILQIESLELDANIPYAFAISTETMY